MNIVVFGIGYVGLSNAILLAQNNSVTLIDISKEKVNLINNRVSPIKDELISNYLENKQLDLNASLDYFNVVKDADFIIIATPTNYNEDTSEFDTSSIDKVINDVFSINKSVWIVIKSTVGIGFMDSLTTKYPDGNFLFSPEFLREGKALFDNLYPSRIVVGVREKSALYLQKASEFASLLTNGAIKKDICVFYLKYMEAEAVKLFSNTYLAMRVAFFNELDTFCMHKGLSSNDIIKSVCADPRICDFYNNPSFGYGGYCLPKDTKELKSNFKNINERLMTAIVESNECRSNAVAQYIKIVLNNINNPVVGIFRLAMKSGSDNNRSSSTIMLIENLLKQNISVVIFDELLHESFFCGCKVINDLNDFKNKSSLIVCNRYDRILDDIKGKVFTRDLFFRD